jgi:hypothetical protein
MTRRATRSEPSLTAGEVSQHRDGEDGSAPNPTTIQRLYDTALARCAVGGDRSLQRYASVLITAPRLS